METMASYILHVLTESPFVVFSWGAQEFTQLSENKGLSFIVNGFVFKGKIEIIYDAGCDLFNVKIGDTEYQGIYFDELIRFIDEKVEKNCSDEIYENQIIEWLLAIENTLESIDEDSE